MKYDLIIIGGGLVGSSLALALRQSKLRIALLEARMPTQDDPRLFALNYSSCQLLKNLNIFNTLAEKASPILQVHVSRQGHFGAVRLHHYDAGLTSLGHVIPAAQLEISLQKALQQADNLHLYQPAALNTIQQENGMATLTITSSQGIETLQAPLVIGADGTDSTVRRQLNIATETIDYAQSAIVTRVQLKRFHQHIAFERFNAAGAIAMLPLAKNECASIWSTDTKTAQALMGLEDEAYLNTLQQNFGYRLGRLEHITKRHLFPLRMVQAKKMVEGCVLLLGNAAHTLHPIAAQGFNLALYEVATLADLLNSLSASEISANSLQVLLDFTAKQRHLSTNVSHYLSSFFTNHTYLPSILIQAGMIGFDITTSLKGKFLRGILGQLGNSPPLLHQFE